VENINPPITTQNLFDDSFNYPDLLGKQAWQNLHPAIQKRFSVKAHEAVTYKGEMSQVFASFTGKVLAQVCRIIGTPLALHTGKNIPVEVKVYPNNKLGGMTWDRFYHFSKKAVNRVKSTKCLQENTGLVEMVGCGFGMELNAFEKESAIYFESTRFFWQMGKFKIIIPDLLSPGKTVVSQKALNDKQFRFRLDVTHALLGKVFKQVGIFEAVTPN